jgi:putative pyruvate formate lyase activating enzyme
MQISRHCRGKALTTADLADLMIRLQEGGCSNINLVSPTHYSPWIFTALDRAAGQGLKIPVVVNSGGYETTNCLDQWMGYAGIYLMDLKYGDNHTGKALSAVPDYWDRAREAITHLYRTAGPLKTDSEGRAVNGLMVRHLLLPGMLSNPFAVLEFLADLSTNIPLSLMSQYNPAFYQGDDPEMKRTVTEDEYQVVLNKALDFGFSTIYAQDMEAATTYNPDFDDATPFGDQLKLL